MRCQRPLVISALLTGPDGAIRPEIAPLADYLLTHRPTSDSFIRWLHKSAAAAVLRDIANGRLALTPAAIIDRAPRPQTATFILTLLVDAGVLPDIDVQRARFDHWILQWTITAAPEDRLILRRYASWGPGAGTHPAHALTARSALRTRAQLRHCRALLEHIRDTGHTLDSYPQRDLDTYCVRHPAHRDALIVFTNWLTRHRLSSLRILARPRTHLQGKGVTSDHRWEMAQQFLYDPAIAPAERVAGLLVLLYATPLTRITRITHDQIDPTGRSLTLAPGSEPIILPDVLAQAIRALNAAQPRPSVWLFPGRNPGCPLGPAALSQRLQRHGLNVANARATALMELAQQMHPRVLSDLLGIHRMTATAWWQLAGGDWSTYPAMR